MAETSSVVTVQASDSISTPAEMRAAIVETRARLSSRLARTADHVHTVFTVPSSAQKEASEGGLIGGAIRTIAVAGQTTRAWHDAKGAGLFRRAAIGAVTVAVAAAFAAKIWPRVSNPTRSGLTR